MIIIMNLIIDRQTYKQADNTFKYCFFVLVQL